MIRPKRTLLCPGVITAVIAVATSSVLAQAAGDPPALTHRYSFNTDAAREVRM